MRIAKVRAPLAGLCLLLAGCANTDWQKPGTTAQDQAADWAACDAYLAQDEAGSVTVDINSDPRIRAHPRLAAWRHKHIAGHAAAVQKHAVAHAKSDNGNAKGEAIAATVVLAVDVGVLLAERAQAHDECMAAMGWAPGKPDEAPVRLASNAMSSDAPDGARVDPPQLMRVEDGPVIGDEPRQHVTYWQVIPDAPESNGLTCTSTYPHLEGC